MQRQREVDVNTEVIYINVYIYIDVHYETQKLFKFEKNKMKIEHHKKVVVFNYLHI